jgi:hypothetical protein
LVRIEESCFWRCLCKEVSVPNSVEVLPISCFAHAAFERLVFEEESQLFRIEELSFARSRVQSICIPQNVAVINGTAFNGSFIPHPSSLIPHLSVDRGNRRYCMNQSFLFGFVNSVIVRYFSEGNDVAIWSSVKVLGKTCFAHAPVSKVRFAAKSSVTRIE